MRRAVLAMAGLKVQAFGAVAFAKAGAYERGALFQDFEIRIRHEKPQETFAVSWGPNFRHLIGRPKTYTRSGEPDLGAELFAALCATGIDDLAASFGGHACAETVAVRTNAVGRLKRALHRISPVRGQNQRIRALLHIKSVL